MGALRNWIGERRGAVTLLIACALALKLLVPAGYMPAPGQVAIQLCTGEGMRTALLDAEGNRIPDGQPNAKPAVACAYAGLAAPMLSGADPLLLATAILLALALGIRPQARPASFRTLAPRPPGQAPPAFS